MTKNSIIKKSTLESMFFVLILKNSIADQSLGLKSCS